jgi:hypothetical protein
VFGISFAQWIGEGEERSLAEIQEDVLGELITLAGSSGPTAAATGPSR